MTDLDRQMADAMKRQGERARASMAVDRKGWTTDQWCEDADRLMNEDDGAVTSLVNGHVLALLRVHREWQALKVKVCPECQSDFQCMNRQCPTRQPEAYPNRLRPGEDG